MEPTIADSFCCRNGIAPIARHERTGMYQHLTNLTGRKFITGLIHDAKSDARQRMSTGTNILIIKRTVTPVLARCQRGDTANFGRAIAMNQNRAETLNECLKVIGVEMIAPLNHVFE